MWKLPEILVRCVTYCSKFQLHTIKHFLKKKGKKLSFVQSETLKLYRLNLTPWSNKEEEILDERRLNTNRIMSGITQTSLKKGSLITYTHTGDWHASVMAIFCYELLGYLQTCHLAIECIISQWKSDEIVLEMYYIF